ncbi:hypothetical protein M427DRAFT_36983 [Gonapodya prolifera JEL478]|uniref:EF-hand domain-containing protein n=1 Tax=Gonapodya prolifera (strain JEL478) TaxID=1344416 RepID=A0A139A0Z0_GONPJ|nr:hypothetical protein M427DRAFT_36983 [Gonapodya prolifera JEL478]|eukprot:KXS10446.1 hypothetical protein M427DRAFT_36983 [Gonapodya prolifera JEL478]
MDDLLTGAPALGRKKANGSRSRQMSSAPLAGTMQRVSSRLFGGAFGTHSGEDGQQSFQKMPVDSENAISGKQENDKSPSPDSQPFEWMAEDVGEKKTAGPHKADNWKGGDDDSDDGGCFWFWNGLSTRGRWILVNSVAACILLPIFFISKFAFDNRTQIANVALSLWALFCAITVFSMAGCRMLVWAMIAAWKASDRRLQNVEKTQLVESLQGWITIALWSILNYAWWIWILVSQVCPATGDCQRTPVTSIFLGVMISSIFFFFKSYLFHSFVRSFHREAYQDRLSKLRFAEFVLDSLREARKKNSKPAHSNRTKSAIPASSPRASSRPEDKSMTLPAGFSVHIAEPQVRLSIDDANDPAATQIDIIDTLPKSPVGNHHRAESPAGKSRSEPNIPVLQQPPTKKTFNSRMFFPPLAFAIHAIRKKSDEDTSTSSLEENEKTSPGSSSVPKEGDDAREEAKRFAKKTFEWLCPPGRVDLILADFEPLFSKLTTTQKAFALFDRNENGSISRREMKMTVVETFEEQRHLTKSIEDMHHALTKLDLVLSVITVFLLFWVWLLIFGVDLQSVFVTLTSLLVLSTYVIGGSLKDTFSCIIFLFVTHPYDVGDLIQVPGHTMSYIVVEMNILTTTFRRTDGMTVLASNTVLSNMFISNIRRSAPMSQSVQLDIPIDTPVEKIHEIKQRMSEWVQKEAIDYSSFDVNITDLISESFSMKVSMSVKHRDNWQDGSKKSQRQTRFLTQLTKVLQELGVTVAREKPVSFVPAASALSASMSQAFSPVQRGLRTPE